MFGLEPIFEFSRNNCSAICSFLVPANLLTTVITITLAIENQSRSKILGSMGIASLLAIALFLHVSTWFIIGVITPITFILFGLGSTCLMINVLAVIYRQAISQIISSKLSRS